MLPSAAARPRSHQIITRLRFQRSTSAPAGNPNSTAGIQFAKLTSPTFAGESVSERTSSG